MRYNANSQSIAEIDSRLAALKEEQKQLLALREQLQKTSPIYPDSTSYSPEQKVSIFRSLFRGRNDIFANRWQNKLGRSGYSVACNNEWAQGICHKPRIKCQDCNHRQFTEINDQIIYRHLAGQLVVGLYPLMQDNTCYFLAADFDKGKWQEEVKAMSNACQNFEIPHAIEISRSGNGAHLWIFFNENVPAKEARLLGFGLLDKAMELYPSLSFHSYDRLFPNQDILPEGGFGNLIALPLQKEARLSGFSSFADPELHVIQDQWQHLAQMKAISHQDLSKLLTVISPNATLFDEQEVVEKKPPWQISAKTKPLALENPPTKVSVTLANHVYFDLSEIPSALAARLRRLASFSNPVFFKTQALRFSTHGIPRFISCARIDQGYLAIPRGCLDEARDLLTENQIELQINDKRESGTKLTTTKSSIKLRKNQEAAVRAMIKHDAGILHAPTAFGKTVTAIAMITKRKANTLILVHTRQLLDQWKERLKSFMPNIDVGTIGGGKKKPTGIIDIATYQSLIDKKNNSISELVQDYGHVIVDECHHVSAPRFEMVLNEIRAKYLLGLTATPERQDGHQKIIFMVVGPIRHKIKNTLEDKFEQQVIAHQIYNTSPSSQSFLKKSRKFQKHTAGLWKKLSEQSASFRIF